MIGWCSECWEPVNRVAVNKGGKWFGPCGHTTAVLLSEKPIRWRAP